MLKLIGKRSRTNLFLDAVFVFWLLQIMLTGRILPQAVVDLVHPPAPITAVVEPKDPPPNVQPAIIDPDASESRFSLYRASNA